MNPGFEKLFHLAVLLGAGATAVYLMTKASISARQGNVIQDEIAEVPPKDLEEDVDAEDNSDLLSSYWAGAIPEGM